MRTPYLLAAAIVVLAASVFGWFIHAEPSTRDAARPLRAFYAIEPPFAFIDGHGRVTGESPEILRVLAHRAGLGEVEFVHAEFGQLLHELDAGRADIIASGLFVTPERALHARFTRPTARVGMAMLVASGNPLKLHSLEDVATRGDAVLAVIDGAVEPMQASRAGVPGERIQRHGDAMSAAVAVIEGRADALVLSDASLRYMLDTAGLSGVELAEPFSSPQHDGHPDTGSPAYAVRPANEALARRLDEALAAYLGSAEHRSLVAPFGFGGLNMPVMRAQ